MRERKLGEDKKAVRRLHLPQADELMDHTIIWNAYITITKHLNAVTTKKSIKRKHMLINSLYSLDYKDL